MPDRAPAAGRHPSHEAGGSIVLGIREWDGVPMRSAERDEIVDLARAVVQELAPDEIGLFPETSKAYFRRPRPGRTSTVTYRDPLGMGVESWAPMVSFAALGTAQSVLLFLGTEVRKGLQEQSASTIRAWIKRGFRRLGPADDPPHDGAPQQGSDALTRHQLSLVRQHAYTQAVAFEVPADLAAKIADTIVGRLALHSDDE
jgi:hypothetical protein